MITIDTTNMCSHLQRKLFEEDGIYHSLWIAMQDDPELTAAVRSRQLHIYRNCKKVLVLAGKSAPKIIREDAICELLQIERIKWMEQRFNKAAESSLMAAKALLKRCSIHLIRSICKSSQIESSLIIFGADLPAKTNTFWPLR